MLSFAIVWFFIATSVEFTAACIVKKYLIAEHWLYLATVGLAIFLTAGLFYLLKNVNRWKAVLIFIVVIFSLMTYDRNKLWQNEIALWQDVIKKSPENSAAYYALGNAYTRKGFNDRAIDFYQRALQLNPQFSEVLNNLGTLYGKRGEYTKAIMYFEQILQFNPKYGSAYHNLGFIYYLMGRFDEAVGYLEKSIALQKNYADSYNYLAMTYRELGQTQEAKTYFKKAETLYKKQHLNAQATNVKKILKTLEN